jgi:hypothetical protein
MKRVIYLLGLLFLLGLGDGLGLVGPSLAPWAPTSCAKYLRVDR